MLKSGTVFQYYMPTIIKNNFSSIVVGNWVGKYV